MSRPSSTFRAVGAAVAPPAVLCLLGALLMGLSYTQPAWIDDRIGPGLFAQWLSKGVVGLALVWAVVSLLNPARRHRAGDPIEPTARPGAGARIGPGLALLLAVLLFILLMPITGLVGACTATAVAAGWGAGDRHWRALAASALLAAASALTLGLTLLPPTTRLWPWGPF